MPEVIANTFGERWETAPPEVEQLEAAWWEKYAWLEDEYAWVHSPDVRQILRQHYLKMLIASIPRGGAIVDFGCGPGWLAILLAQLGAERVVGIDNAPAQLAIAKKRVEEAGLSSKVQLLNAADPEVYRIADVLVVHGVLHHLSKTEIADFLALLRANLRPGARIFLLEPVLGKLSYRPWSVLHRLICASSTRRRQSEEEKRLRALLESRGDGPRYPGYGVAPKERPFVPGELESYLAPHFTFESRKPVLFLSVRVATELLLLGKTYPWLSRAMIKIGLPAYMAWERLSLKFVPNELWNGWVFCLFEARV